jgi:transcription initiation factor TFIID subunit 9B
MARTSSTVVRTRRLEAAAMAPKRKAPSASAKKRRDRLPSVAAMVNSGLTPEQKKAIRLAAEAKKRREARETLEGDDDEDEDEEKGAREGARVREDDDARALETNEDEDEGRGKRRAPRDAAAAREILREMVRETRDATDATREDDERAKEGLTTTREPIRSAQGVTDVDRKVISQGMEFMHRYASEALEESACAARHAGRGTIDAEDVKIGAKAILMRQFIEPPSLADAHAMAAVVNRHPLPKLSNRPGIHVPTEMNLLNDNWDIGPPKAVDASSIELERAAEARKTAGARARAPKTAIEPSALADARDAVAFGVKAPAPAAAPAEDLGEFAEFMDDDDDDDDE